MEYDAQRVYQLEDLNNWDFSGVSLAVLGHPIKHSISPQMHNAALKVMAEDDPQFADWRYFKFDVHPERLPEAIRLLHEHEFRGVNLTIPHKVDIISLLKERDPIVSQMGAANTLLWQDAGYTGFNTDGFGLEQALKWELGVVLKGANVILLGAGGAARAAAVQCLESECRALWIGNRNQERLASLLTALEEHRNFGRVQGFDLTEGLDGLPLRDVIVVNATALGLKEGDSAPIDLSCFEQDVKVYDMIYNPKVTALLKVARFNGYSRANGLSMLVLQGAKSLEIWSDDQVPVDAMMKAAKEAVGNSA